MNDILKAIPPMFTGAALHQALAVNPDYDPSIRYASAAERLVALNSLYDIYYPFSMSSAIYSKMYLAMIPLKCYELLSAKSKAEQERLYQILIEMDKYKHSN